MMFHTLLRWSLRYRVLTLGAALALTLAGLQAWLSLPIDAFPDISPTQAKLILKVPGMTPQEVEQRVVRPIEQELLSLPKKRVVRSVSKYGIADITIDFEDGADIYWARQQVSERLSQELTRALMEDQLDVALMSAPAPDPGLVVIPLFWEYMWVLSAPGRARVGGVVHSLESIRELPLVQTTADSLPRRFLQDKSVQDRVPLNVRVECDSLTSIKELVSKGDLAHISPQSAFIEELREGRVEGTPIPGLRLVRAAVRRADRPPGAATAAFLKNISRRVQAVMPRKQLLLAGSKAADAPP